MIPATTEGHVVPDDIAAEIIAGINENGDADAYNVIVPNGGFLAVIFRGGNIKADRLNHIQNMLADRTGVKCIVFNGDFVLAGVSPEEKK